eukprot:TRINITY_DN10445_c0_g1_i1.p1 TRINITY_DN10445_c0_g1~~TRINITY_DN10445_c0_g1_i1.p1  ORF type:complete len:136 (+),score=24.56 TRINITY_DN10445_c0_g1_i1:2-409(+)
MYGDDIDFAVPYSSYTITKSGAVATGTKEYLSSVRCPSSTYANLSQCTATLTPTASQSPCTSGWGMVSCKLTHDNIVFSIDVLVSIDKTTLKSVSYTHLRAHETPEHLVCRLLLEKKKNTQNKQYNKLINIVIHI